MRRSVPITLLAGIALLACGDDSGPDTTPPTVASVAPANGATDVPLDADVVVTFSEPVDPTTVTPASVSLALGAFTVPATRTMEDNNRRVRMAPTSGLGNNSVYAVSVTGAVTDAAANPLSAAPVNTSFETVPAAASVNDGVGDAFGSGTPLHDLTTFSAAQGSITIVLQFSGTIARASANVANSVGGYVDIDVDQDGSTGVTAFTDAFRNDGGSTGLGIEYHVELFDNLDGSLSVLDAGNIEVGTVIPTFGASSITFTIPQSMIGNDDGNVDLATVIGTLAEPTDFAPNAGHLTLGTSGLPASAALGAFGSLRAVRTLLEWRPVRR